MTTQQIISLPATGKAGGTHERVISPDRGTTDLLDYIAQQTTHLTDFDESLVRRWIKQITIWDDHFTVELKSGLKIDIEG